MRLNLVSILAVAGVLPFVHSIKCGSHDILKKYQVDQAALFGEVERNTPPSTTKDKWWLRVCEDGDGKDDERFKECDSRDVLCGVTEVTLKDKDPILTHVIDFKDNLAYNVNEDEGRLHLVLDGAKWGEYVVGATVDFTCNNNMKTDEVVSSSWSDDKIQLSLRGPSGCLKKNQDAPPNNGDNSGDGNGGSNDDKRKENAGSGWSWFSWVFIYAILFTLIYLLVTSYMNTRGGNMDDFRAEFTERSKQLVVALPEFCKEVLSKIFGSRSSSQRVGYSAV
ncbi:Atg27p KNAG_0C02330 [Huiozyma naganishii CBS 8797]|uniref:Autophagy-related protein 27 n=1 Tax=Huiozyma naganishii (strain ATCC MYA-139 / BCRC 22969 / CBS 8797 / KCTC 17520 / NBRC 10181 / NCYC 3082 / Yp74L-3) TaxID=1071383 RepID=J7S4K7_HUIN7|nr:hypothetical protein KNAG_0C02330 [Kazachstania naganishii CBS 8797]CCK69344.1 hypothetical protein KNAG_0C02330 [Kazachstania naganishii CBS 8797]